MERKPRPSDQPILGRQLLTWLAFVGIVMGIGTLAVIAWGMQEFGEDVGRSMGLATFSIMNIAFSLGTKDMLKSSLSADVLGDRTFVMATILSLVITFAASELGPLQRLLGTVSLSFDQWLLCLVVGWSILLLSEIRKIVWKRPLDERPDADTVGLVAHS